MSSASRSEILRRIRAANHGESSLQVAAEAWSGIPRTYQRDSTRSHESILELFIERLRDYDAHVERSTSTAVSSAIERIIKERGQPRMLAASAFSYGLPEGSTMDEGFSNEELDTFSGVLTEATLAIAETGTLILQNVPGQGRRAASLVPDFHLCILHASDIVETVPEAIGKLAATSTLPTTFISGPSATADIEMTRIKGVHGPRFLHVVLVD